MTLKEKSKTYTFWISLISALIVLAKTIAEHFGYNFNQNLLLGIATFFASILVLVGVIAGPSKKATLQSLEEKSREIYDEEKKLNNQIKEDIMEQNLTLEEQLEFLKHNIAEKANETLQNSTENDQKQQNQIETDPNYVLENQISMADLTKEETQMPNDETAILEPEQQSTKDDEIVSIETEQEKQSKYFEDNKAFNIEDYSIDELKAILVKIITNIL